MAKRESKIKFGPFVFGHTKLIGSSGTFELWNNLSVFFEQKKVLRALKIPSGVLPIGPHGKLIFGEGQFGKVRLAKQGKRFLAVKKMPWEDGKEALEEQMAYREYSFSKEMASKRSPDGQPLIKNVMIVEAILDASNGKGKHTIYQFMEPATLGTGTDLKRLLNNLDHESREKVLLYVMGALLDALGSMHQFDMYHRDVKATNILVNHDGSVYLSDFGSSFAASPKFNGHKPFQVNETADFRYLSPEMIGVAIGQAEVDQQIRYTPLLDSWRLGLTLLQLCGCIKENEGILRNFTRLPEEEQVFPKYYYDQIEQIKANSLDKIPESLRYIIFSLLEVDPYKRPTIQEVLEILAKPSDNQPHIVIPKKEEMESIFNVMTRYHIPEAMIIGIKKALKNETVITPLKELEKEYPRSSHEYKIKRQEFMLEYKKKTKALKELLATPDLRLHNLNQFTRKNLKNSKSFIINQEQFKKISAMLKLRALEKNENIKIMSQDFTSEALQKMQNSLYKIEFSIKDHHENIPSQLFDLLTLTYQIKKTQDFSQSYPHFYPIKEDFHKKLKMFRKLQGEYQHFIKQVYGYLKDELMYLHHESEHQRHLSHPDFLHRYDQILNTKDVLLEIFQNSELSKKKMGQFKKLLEEIERDKATFKERHEHISHNSVILSSTHEPFAQKWSAYKPTSSERKYFQEATIENVMASEKSYSAIPAAAGILPPETSVENAKEQKAGLDKKIGEVEVEGTNLSYRREQGKLIYDRPEKYLEDYLQSHVHEKQDVDKLGYSTEEKKLVLKMAEEFLKSGKQFVSIRGNKHLTRLIANHIHHHNTSIKIRVNGVHFHDPLVHQFEKLIHSNEPQKSHSLKESLKSESHH